MLGAALDIAQGVFFNLFHSNIRLLGARVPDARVCRSG